jgi:hypothetical protein
VVRNLVSRSQIQVVSDHSELTHWMVQVEPTAATVADD